MVGTPEVGRLKYSAARWDAKACARPGYCNWRMTAWKAGGNSGEKWQAKFLAALGMTQDQWFSFAAVSS